MHLLHRFIMHLLPSEDNVSSVFYIQFEIIKLKVWRTCFLNVIAMFILIFFRFSRPSSATNSVFQWLTLIISMITRRKISCFSFTTLLLWDGLYGYLRINCLRSYFDFPCFVHQIYFSNSVKTFALVRNFIPKVQKHSHQFFNVVDPSPTNMVKINCDGVQT